MKHSDTYKHYLRDLIYILKERKHEMSIDTPKDDFTKGIEFGYQSILNTIENQAVSFQIELKEIGFNNFDKYQENS